MQRVGLHLAPAALAVVLAVALSGCQQGPGHTRAAGTAVGTAAGALLGAAAAPCDRGSGALVGAGLGMIAGSLVGEGIAQDQERCGCPPCRPRPRCTACQPQPVPRRTIIRRRVYIVEDGVQRPAEEVVEEIVEDAPDYGYGGR